MTEHDNLLDSLKSFDDLRERFAVLVGPRDDVACGVRIDAGGLVCHVVHRAIGMPEGAREGKDHAGLELRARGARDRHDKTASIVQLSNARPLPGFRIIAPDRGLFFADKYIAAAGAAGTLRCEGLFFSPCLLHDLPLGLVEAVELVEILSFPRPQGARRPAEGHDSQEQAHEDLARA